MNKGTKRNKRNERVRKVRAMLLGSIAMFIMSVVILITSFVTPKALSEDEARMMACSHDMKVETIMPTCEEEGYRKEYCELCGYVEEYTIEAMGHDFIVEYNELAEVYAHVCEDCGVVVHTHK